MGCSTQKLLGECIVHSELWFGVNTLLMGAQLLQMFNNHLFLGIQCFCLLKMLRGRKGAGLFASVHRAGQHQTASLWNRAGAQLCSMGSSSP